MERTFLMIKPDGVQRGLVGEIIGRFEKKGFKLAELKMLTPPREMVEAHYAAHQEKPFFAGVVSFVTSGPVAAMVWEGENIIEISRKMMGATKPIDAAAGTIRGDFSNSIEQNLIHGSDSAETSASEIELWFGG